MKPITPAQRRQPLADWPAQHSVATHTVTVCRECNQRFGAGRHHFATCAQHKNESWHAANDRAALALQISKNKVSE